MAIKEVTNNPDDLSEMVNNYVVNELNRGVDLNTLLYRFRGLIPPHELCEIENAEDAQELISLAVQRLFKYH